MSTELARGERSGPFGGETGIEQCSDGGAEDRALRSRAWMTAVSQSAWISSRHKCVDPATEARGD